MYMISAMICEYIELPWEKSVLRLVGSTNHAIGDRATHVRAFDCGVG